MSKDKERVKEFKRKLAGYKRDLEREQRRLPAALWYTNNRIRHLEDMVRETEEAIKIYEGFEQ